MKILKIFRKSLYKTIKYIKKGKHDKLKDLFEDSKEDIWDELRDFLEDWREDLGGEKKPKKFRNVMMYGTMVKIRPAYLFAERLENFIKFIFAISIIISGFVASIWGFPGISDLLNFLISSLIGRIIIIIIGFCYLIISTWKLIHVKD